jgi:DNA topoisomerase-3
LGKHLVITEKPSVARDIAAALGSFEEKGEYLESSEYVLAWAVGHLLSLAEPQHYDKKLKSWSIRHLPIIPERFELTPRDGQRKRLQLLRKLGRRKDVVGLINACDAGREGEMIFRRIVEYGGLAKPVQRLWLQSMTSQSILGGFEALRPGSDLDSLADAAWCRSVGDWLIGMNATRALTQRLKSRGEKGAWSAGRVQTPTLHMLVARERQILAHVSRQYWVLFATFRHGDQEWEAQYWGPRPKPDASEGRPNRIFDRLAADRFLEVVRDASTGVAAEKRKRARQNPPLPLDLTSLQREANRRHSFSARRTLDAAQRLYEGHKLITYPRTDCRYLPDDYGAPVHQVLERLSVDREYQDLADRIQADGPQNLGRILDSSRVSDHFAIIPTGARAGALSPDDHKIYDLVVRAFLASLMGPATWSNVERTVVVGEGTDAVRFRKTTRSLEVAGFLEALGRKVGDGTDLPPLVPGRDTASGVEVALLEVREEEKQTKPPSRFSEAALLRMMETAGRDVGDEELSSAMKDKGLGTPATRAEIIEGLIRKQYARRVDRRIAPTSKAMRLMDVIDRVDVPTLASARLTGAWEHDLKRVQSGGLEKAQMYARLTEYTRNVVENLVGFDHERLYEDEPPLGACPACDEGKVVETAWGYPCNRNTAADSPCNFMIWKDRAGRYIDRNTARRLVEERKVGPVSGFVDRYGRGLEGTLELVRDPENGKWLVDVLLGSAVDAAQEEEVGVLCESPVNEGDEIVETSLRYVSRKVLDGRARQGPVLPKVVCHREISPAEALQYFSEPGKTEILDGFLSKRGRPFRGALFRKATGKHGFEFPPREPNKRKSTTKSKKPATRKKGKTGARDGFSG